MPIGQVSNPDLVKQDLRLLSVAEEVKFPEKKKGMSKGPQLRAVATENTHTFLKVTIGEFWLHQAE